MLRQELPVCEMRGYSVSEKVRVGDLAIGTIFTMQKKRYGSMKSFTVSYKITGTGVNARGLKFVSVYSTYQGHGSIGVDELVEVPE